MYTVGNGLCAVPFLYENLQKTRKGAAHRPPPTRIKQYVHKLELLFILRQHLLRQFRDATPIRNFFLFSSPRRQQRKQSEIALDNLFWKCYTNLATQFNIV